MSFFMRTARSAALTVGIGAATSYFMDSQLGRQRRRDVVDRVSELVGAVRDDRRATARSDHGDGDPTGGGVPVTPVPTVREE